MKRVLVPLAEGFEEIEAVTLIDVLRRGGIEVVVGGLEGDGAVVGAHGLSITPDTALAAAEGPWDLVLLPGGMGGTQRMIAHQGLRDLLRARVESGAPVAAICAAPMVLDAAGVLPQGRFTMYPGLEGRLSTGGALAEDVVDAGVVLTSRGPATAMRFALHLVGRLMGGQVREQVAAGLLFVGE
ncbi:MAG: DJ-1/PfpI family protein [Deltaproteobacteria bacterium]|nr:DJ-1/PfpI family protein [Deltaproteobacteria bacterium]